MTTPSMRSISSSLHSVRTAVLVVAVLFALTIACGQAAPAQTFSVLHNFTAGSDGADPWGGLTIDAAGNLYGTASYGGNSTNCEGGCGTVFKLSQRNSNWTFSPLYSFSKSDGAYPEGRLIFGHDGKLYGTTGQGGMPNNGQCETDGCGIIFAMQPPATFCPSVTCYWTERVLYEFTGGNSDGSRPTGDTAFDSSGNLFGTAYEISGTVWELSPAGGGWNFTAIHNFSELDALNPYGGVVLDSAGNIYGETEFGGSLNKGATYELQYPSWTETNLHNFNGTDGDRPLGGMVLDANGNLYSTTNRGGANGGGGQVYTLTNSGGNWTLTDIASFAGFSGPWGNILMDHAGNIYGTTVQDGAYSFGSVFKLMPSGGGYTLTTLHDFNGQDGAYPHGAIVMDASGNLYGTATAGGPHNQGVAWEITP